jgi:hypothetical protein
MSMTLVSTVTVGSGGATSIDFTSLPQSATDLIVVASLRGSIGVGADSIFIRFNSDTTATNYRVRSLLGEATSVYSFNLNSSQIFYSIQGTAFTSNTFASSSFYIPNYSTSLSKSFSVDAVTENNSSTAGMGIQAGSWNSTSAITSVTLDWAGNSIAQHSTASLYIVTKGSGGATTSP